MKALTLFLFLLGSTGLTSAAPLTFSAQERAWMHQHPVVEYSIDPYWPIEYVENGQHRGLTRDFIDHVQQVTGLRFVRVPADNWTQTLQRLDSGQVQLASAVSERLLSPSARQQMLLTQPYFFGASVVITQASVPMLFTAQRLAGKTVAVKGGGGYERYLRVHYPEVKLLLLGDADQAPAAVDEGRADAAVGLDAVLQPVMRRKYAGRLHLAGVLSEMPVVLTMAVTPRDPILLGIIDKALGSLTSRDTDEIFDRWLVQTDFGAPTWQSLGRHYAPQIMAGAGLLALLSWLAWRARRAQRQAQASEGRMAAFLAMMSHEIRTPMNAVQSAIELLRRGPLSGRQHELVALAHGSAANLLELLDDVLDISRLDAGAVALDPQPVDVEMLAESVAAIHRIKAEHNQVALHAQSQGLGKRLICIDAGRLRQILSNLLSNAVKFTEEGAIHLHIEWLLTHLDSRGLLVITVTDTGIGIAAQHQADLFQAFVQAESSTARRYGGSGLGLSICKQLVQLMGGEIELRSEPGRGTRVVCRLPASLADERASVMAPIAPSALPRRILVVEDHELNQHALRLQLEQLGHSPLMVSSGEQALEIIQVADDIGLILLDCQLPGLDGYEVARRIRGGGGSRSRVPIVAISGASDALHHQRCRASGMNDVLVKPLGLDELAGVCQRFLQSGTLTSGAQQDLAALHGLFLRTCQEDLEHLHHALDKPDVSAAIGYAHRIHGAAMMVGAHAIAECAAELEQHLAAVMMPPEGWQDQLPAMQAALSEFAAQVTLKQ